METICYFDVSASRISADHLSYKQIETGGFRLHSHDTWELLFVKKGCISYMAEGRCYIVEGGNCILSPPGIRHSISFRDSDVYDRYAILFNSPLFDTLPKYLEVVDLSSTPTVQELFRKMDFYAAYLDGEYLELAITNLTEEILLNFRIIQQATLETYTANPIVMDAIDYIDRYLDKDISLEQLCHHLHITKSYLNRLFVTHLQLSPAKYITVKRLNKARMEIRAGAKPTGVYSLCGFQDYCTFYRNYIRYFGYPPSEEQAHPPVPKIEW